MSDLRINQLPIAEATAKAGVYAIYDPITDKTVQISIQSGIGAVRASIDWNAATTYAIDDIVLFQGLTAWKSLQNSNTGNVPSENAFWTQLTISDADGITDTQWSAGLFTYNNSKIISNNTQYYLQTAAPFESTDVAAEIIAGDWATSIGGGIPSNEFVITGDSFTAIDIGENILINELETASGTYALPTIGSLTATEYIVNLKNVSGGNVTITSSDGIDGENSVQLIDTESIQIYVSSAEYKVI